MSTAAFASEVAERQRGDAVSELASSPMSTAAFVSDVAERRRGHAVTGLAAFPMSTARWGSSPSTAGEEDA